MRRINFTVVYEQANDGYWNAFAVDLPVVANADTREEIEVRIREAIEFHLESASEAAPTPTRRRSEVGIVTVTTPA